MNVDELINALENEKNENIIELSYEYEQQKHNVLDDLHLSSEEKQDFLKKLNDYIYVDDMPSIQHGSYIRWIPLRSGTYIFDIGGHVCDINICNKGSSVVCKCKSFKKPIYLQVKMDEAFIFRKLNYQELILLEAIKYLEKK